MNKRKKRSARKKKGSFGGKLIKLAMVLGFIIGSGWWLFFSDSDSAIRKVVLQRFSFIVDRVDEVSDAWQARSIPDPGPDVGAPKKSAAKKLDPATKPDKTTRPEPNVTKPPPDPVPETNTPKPDESGEKKPVTPTYDDVTEQDKEELDNLFLEISGG